MAMFKDTELAELIDQPFTGIARVIHKSRSQLSEDNFEWSESDYEVLIEALAVVGAILELRPEVQIVPPAITGVRDDDCVVVLRFLEELDTFIRTHTARESLARHKDRIQAVMGTKLMYEFSQGDLERLQVLINELRDLVAATESLSQEHRQRLLRRLERMQSELHKRTSDLDRFYGLVGEAGVVLGKLGRDAKPIVDRVREIAQIVWGTQARAEELPSGTKPPVLEHED